MEKLIAACGLDCATCECREATLANDNEMRKVVAEKWGKMYQADLPVESINCNGCMEPGLKFGHCNECDIRACVRSKGINHCAECKEYPCPTITEFLGFVPQAKANLEEIRGLA